MGFPEGELGLYIWVISLNTALQEFWSNIEGHDDKTLSLPLSPFKRHVRALFWKPVCALFLYFQKYQYLNPCFHRALLLWFANRCAALAWSRGPHDPREGKMLPLEKIPEAGRSCEQAAWQSVSDCLSYKSWCCEGVHTRQMFLLFRGLQIFRLERKERRKGEKKSQFSHLHPYSKLSLYFSSEKQGSSGNCILEWQYLFKNHTTALTVA